jgi:hypothetical protein
VSQATSTRYPPGTPLGGRYEVLQPGVYLVRATAGRRSSASVQAQADTPSVCLF